LIAAAASLGALLVLATFAVVRRAWHSAAADPSTASRIVDLRSALRLR
jgi:hypothetical protein